jgi:preprotein translocase subunit SecY
MAAFEQVLRRQVFQRPRLERCEEGSERKGMLRCCKLHISFAVFGATVTLPLRVLPAVNISVCVHLRGCAKTATVPLISWRRAWVMARLHFILNFAPDNFQPAEATFILFYACFQSYFTYPVKD